MSSDCAPKLAHTPASDTHTSPIDNIHPAQIEFAPLANPPHAHRTARTVRGNRRNPQNRRLAQELIPSGMTGAWHRLAVDFRRRRKRWPALLGRNRVARQLSILCVYGIGHGDVDPDTSKTRGARPSATASSRETLTFRNAITCDFLKYDDLFKQAPLPVAIKKKAFISFGSQIGPPANKPPQNLEQFSNLTK